MPVLVLGNMLSSTNDLILLALQAFVKIHPADITEQ
jgi:hypothetical protein